MALEITPEWISALVSVGWLLLATTVLCLLYPMAIRILRERSFTVEIAGFKLSAQETAESLNTAIKDLQESVRRLETEVPQARGAPRPTEPVASRGGSILWVDDYPINNALIFEKLESDGFRVDRALSTREGLKLFSQRSYDVILSDMGRNEDSRDVPDAGIKLVEALRKSDAAIPIVIFCSNRARELYSERAIAAGANHITSSAVDLYGHIEAALTALNSTRSPP